MAMIANGSQKRILVVGMALLFLAAALTTAQVNYDKGRRTINGVVLLQDAGDEKKFYYLPPYPRLSPLPDGGYEFLAVKFVDPDGETGGGLLHFLVQFDLPPEDVEALQSELRKIVPGAEVMGVVPMSEAGGKGKEDAQAGFRVVSAVLTDSEGGMTRKLITSGHAPLTPGSKAAVAAILNQEGATLLWDTLDGRTSDISVAIHGNYEAVVEGFNARIRAEVETVYEHLSNVLNRQSGYKKRELRNVVDTMLRDAVIEVETLDRSAGLGIDASGMQRIADLCTDKLVELIFNHETGLTKLPERETAVEKGQIYGRQEKGWLAKLFTDSGDQPYYTDDQYVMKRREDISQSLFSITLSGKTTIKVPFDTAGNIRGFYTAHKDDPEMFRIVNLADPSFQKREVHFTIDRDYLAAFKETINFVTVNFRKRYPDQPDATRELQFTHKDVSDGQIHKFVTYPRLGREDSDWLDYEYRLSWSIFGRDTVDTPAGENQWLSGSEAVINLMPPFARTEVALEADRAEFTDNNIQSGVVELRYTLMGEQKSVRAAILRAGDTEPFSSFNVYHDKGNIPEIRVTWYGKSNSGTVREDWKPLDSSYIFLSPPNLAKEEGGEEKPEEKPAEGEKVGGEEREG
jgi:hypothetical protein